MARHKQYQVDNKRVYQYNLTRRCGTVRNLSVGFSRLQELCSPGEATIWDLSLKVYHRTASKEVGHG